ncbi:three-helix bundle dimerization domain-containing protein [Streptomyces sp. NPDC127069]|uniref:three-helix bundle dimerization domain-containing protein n=1 Tax=Streptomyces sp. NPDC127069 TaxID=3347128 RepID=UPI003654801F
MAWREGRFCGLEVVEHGIGTAMTVEAQIHGTDVRPPSEGALGIPGPGERAATAPPPAGAPPPSYEDAMTVRDMVVRLCAAFPSVDAAAVETTVRAEYDAFREARIRAFIPILVERRARRALSAASEQMQMSEQMPEQTRADR